MPLVSQSEYAKHRRVSAPAVLAALRDGRITCEPNGKIDVEKADAQWGGNSDIGHNDKSPIQDNARVTYMEAKRINEVLKAEKQKVELARMRGEQVDKEKAASHIFSLARAERDAWLSWPARVSSQIANELGADAHFLHTLLDREVRRHLEELAEPAIRLRS